MELAARIQEASRREAEENSGRQAEVFLQSDATRADPSSAMARITAAKRTNRATAERESVAEQVEGIENLLAATGVLPGEVAGGLVKLRTEDIQPGEPFLRVVVALDGEAYEFTFEVEPR